jgi:hypothetical protein
MNSFLRSLVVGAGTAIALAITKLILSIIPFLLNFPAHRRRMAWLTGLILFAVGGITPLLIQVGALPLVVLAASAVEIFCGNMALGWVSARLLGSAG